MRRGWRLGIILAILSIYCVGCGQQGQAEKVAQLQAKIEKLEAEVSELKFEQSKFAVVGAASKGFSVSKSSIGLFTVSVDNAQQYLDGYKVKLRLGNLTSAVATGVKLVARWKPEKDVEWKQEDHKITEKLYPGTFNSVEIVMTPATANDIKLFGIAVEAGSVEMRNGR